MSLVLIVWLVNTVIPGLKLLAVFSVMLMFIVAVIGGLILGMEGQWQPIKKAVKYWWVAVLVILLSVLLPNKETTWFMVGAYGTQKLIENPDAQALASDGVDVLKQLLAKAKKELQDTSEKPTK